MTGGGGDRTGSAGGEEIVARLPEMYRQLRELTAQVARLSSNPATEPSQVEEHQQVWDL